MDVWDIAVFHHVLILLKDVLHVGILFSILCFYFCWEFYSQQHVTIDGRFIDLDINLLKFHSFA